MPQESTAITEIRLRIKHIRSMTETPTRRREILGLERALEESIKQASSSSSTPRTTREPKKVVLDTTDYIDTTPRRRVMHEDGRKKVIISNKRRDDSDDTVESSSEKRSRETKIGDIRSILGGVHRGMN